MLYNKPKKVSYTQMCMWVDDNAYRDDCDVEKMFEYIYHICKMLAYKQRYFEKAQYYEDFGIFSASKIFMRYRHEGQFELDESGAPKLNRVKSVLNYAKRVLYPYKVQFEQEFYAQNANVLPDADFTCDMDFHSVMMESVDSIRIEDFKASIRTLESCTRDFISKYPVANAVERENIYISVMLSLLNSIVLDNRRIDNMMEMYGKSKLKMESINKEYRNNMKDSTVLYHLDDSYYDRVKVLTNELRHVISSNLSYFAHTDIPAESAMKSMLMQSINGDRMRDTSWGEAVEN